MTTAHLKAPDKRLPPRHSSRFSRTPMSQQGPSKHLPAMSHDPRRLDHRSKDNDYTAPWPHLQPKSSQNPQPIPMDVAKSDEDESISDEMVTVFDVFDPTSIDIGFDHSCLETLDDQLLLRPKDSFAEVCWAEAVHDDEVRASSPSASSYTVGCNHMRVHFESLFEGDSDECRTYQGDYLPPYGEGNDSREITPRYDSPVMKESTTTLAQPVDNRKSSFILFDPHFPTSHPSDSIHYFPTSKPTNRQRLTIGKGISAFRANLSARLLKPACEIL